MDLRQIEYFKSVIELKSFSLAAQKLFVTQPTITMSIKSLENELGLALIDRSQRNVVMTDAGKMFYECATVILNDVNSTLLQMEALKRKLHKTITVGIAVRSCSKLLPAFFGALPEFNNEFEVEVKEMISPDIYRDVLKNDLDYGLCMIPKNISSDLGVKVLLGGNIKILMSSKHPLAFSEENIPLEQLSDENVLVMCNSNSNKYGMTELIFSEAFKKRGLKHPNMISMADSYTLMCMVAANKGMCLIPDTSSEYMLMMPSTVLKNIDLDDDSDHFSVGLIYNKKTANLKITKTLISFLEDMN